MMKSKALLVTDVTDKDELFSLVTALYNNVVVTHAGFKCKVHEIRIKEEGSKQLGTYKVHATVYLLLMESYEIN